MLCMTSVSRHVVWKMFCGDTPTSPLVIVANTLNFKPNFEFSPLNFFGGDLRPKTFLFVDQISPAFFHRTREESLSITFLSDFGYLEQLRRYSRSKLKVVKNQAEFWTFFSPSQILGGRPTKSYTYFPE